MDQGGYGGAFGGAKAGGAPDPLVFVKRPMVSLRICTLLFAIIVFGCVSSSGWFFFRDKNKEVCVMNEDASACHFSTFVGIIAFIASIGFLVGEWFFEQMSSIKTRKHYVILDMAFSGFWGFMFFVVFCYMCYSWSKSDAMFSFASSNIIGAIFFTFLSIFCWIGCAGLAFQRFKAGTTAAFTEGLGDYDGHLPDGQYQSYPGGPDEGNYHEPPFGQQGMAYSQQQMQY